MITTVQDMPQHIATYITELKAALTGASEKSLLAAKVPQLIAVSKMQPQARIDAALESGHRLYGENRVQEAQGRWMPLRERYHDLTLHLIGPLQTNKTKEALALFDVIQTVDRPKLADKLAALLQEESHSWRTQECFIQINTGEEPQKAGILPSEAGDFIAYCKDELALPVTGLMCIPPAEDDAALHFALLHDMAKQHALPELSMGMSGDYLTAARFGATYVRVGTAVFGERASS